jgi:hypothetical protein
MTEEILKPQEQTLPPDSNRNWLWLIGGVVVGAIVVVGIWIATTILQPEEVEVEETSIIVEPTETEDDHWTEIIYSRNDINRLGALNFNFNAAELHLGDFQFLTRITENEENESFSNYELIRIDEERNETLVYRGSMSPGHLAHWEYSDGYFTFAHRGSPGEAFEGWTRIIFDEDGEEVWRTSYTTPGQLVSFKKNDVDYYADIVTSENCLDVESSYQDGEYSVPNTTLIGLDVWTGKVGPRVELPEPVTIPCGVAYGESIDEPFISIGEFTPEGMLITLPDGTEAWITIQDGQLTATYR